MSVNELILLLCNIWAMLADLFDSAFMIAAIGSAAGAIAGAVAAQRIAERGKRREELLREIRNTNAATALACTIFNLAFGLKKDYVKGMKDRFDAHKAEYIEFCKKRKSATLNSPQFILDHDFLMLKLPFFPTEMLRTLVFDELSLVGRPLYLTVVLVGTVRTLQSLVEVWEQSIAKYMHYYAQGCPEIYFGLPYGDGHKDTTFPTTIHELYDKTDDCIIFAEFLCNELKIHGAKLLDEFKDKFSKKDVPRLEEPDFTETYLTGLMPDKNLYADWENKFVKKNQR